MSRRHQIGPITTSAQILDALMVERRLQDVTVPELAARLHVTTTAVHNLTARGRRGVQPPKLPILVAIADALGLEIHVSLHRKTHPTTEQK